MRITLKITFCTLVWLAANYRTQAQGAFQNLDFEQAKIIPISGSPDFPLAVDVTNAMPGWTAYIGGAAENVIIYDTISLGAAQISIHDNNSTKPVLEGAYTVFLQPSFPSGSLSAGVGQTGQIPLGSMSLSFYGTGAYSVTFAGQQIALSALGTGQNYTIFGGDVSMFANQTGELRFTGAGLLDNIVFSSQAIPEPGTIALSGLALVACVTRLRKKLER